jgi:hypothetical protein
MTFASPFISVSCRRWPYALPVAGGKQKIGGNPGKICD